MNAAPKMEQTLAIKVAVQTYADALGVPAREIPLDQLVALMSACVEAVKVVFREIEEAGR